VGLRNTCVSVKLVLTLLFYTVLLTFASALFFFIMSINLTRSRVECIHPFYQTSSLKLYAKHYVNSFPKSTSLSPPPFFQSFRSLTNFKTSTHSPGLFLPPPGPVNHPSISPAHVNNSSSIPHSPIAITPTGTSPSPCTDSIYPAGHVTAGHPLTLAYHTNVMFLILLFPSLPPYFNSPGWIGHPAMGVVGVRIIKPG